MTYSKLRLAPKAIYPLSWAWLTHHMFTHVALTSSAEPHPWASRTPATVSWIPLHWHPFPAPCTQPAIIKQTGLFVTSWFTHQQAIFSDFAMDGFALLTSNKNSSPQNVEWARQRRPGRQLPHSPEATSSPAFPRLPASGEPGRGGSEFWAGGDTDPRGRSDGSLLWRLPD